MNKYKVEVVVTHSYIVDALAKDESEALEIAHKRWYEEIVPSGTEHYHEDRDPETLIGAVVYDVTDTDDPFNP